LAPAALFLARHRDNRGDSSTCDESVAVMRRIDCLTRNHPADTLRSNCRAPCGRGFTFSCGAGETLETNDQIDARSPRQWRVCMDVVHATIQSSLRSTRIRAWPNTPLIENDPSAPTLVEPGVETYRATSDPVDLSGRPMLILRRGIVGTHQCRSGVDHRSASSGAGPIVVTPEVGGLHHRYDRQAA
jgi:hypothetical protein